MSCGERKYEHAQRRLNLVQTPSAVLASSASGCADRLSLPSICARFSEMISPAGSSAAAVDSRPVESVMDFETPCRRSDVPPRFLRLRSVNSNDIPSSLMMAAVGSPLSSFPGSPSAPPRRISTQRSQSFFPIAGNCGWAFTGVDKPVGMRPLATAKIESYEPFSLLARQPMEASNEGRLTRGPHWPVKLYWSGRGVVWPPFPASRPAASRLGCGRFNFK